MDSRIFERTKEWFESRQINVGYNLQDKDAPRSQQGGVATMTMDRLPYKVSESRGDPRKLCTWTWVRLQGKTTNIWVHYCL